MWMYMYRSMFQVIRMLTFQHNATARHRDDEYNMTVRLYGRQADGKSVSVTVSDMVAYGFVRCVPDIVFRRRVLSLVQWHLSIQRSEQAAKKFKRENDAQMPAADAYRQWRTWWFPKCVVSSEDIQFDECRGHNIRHVRPGPGPTCCRFQVRRYDIWRSLLQLFKHPHKVYNDICVFRRTMSHLATTKAPIPQPPESVEAHLDDADLYETMFKPEVVWMVDHQLPACSWMTVRAADIPATKTTFCDLEYTCGCDDVTPCSTPPVPMAPFRVLSYDIEALPFENHDSGECEFPQPERDPIITIGVCAFDMQTHDMRQTVFMLEKAGQAQCSALPALTPEQQTDAFDPSTTTVCSFIDELEMLKAFAKLIKKYDPDVITGYNVLCFDNVYLIQRIRALCGCNDDFCSHCADARTFSRIARPTTLRKRYTFSKQRGGRESWDAWLEGRDWMDVMRVVMTDHKLRSFKLDNVCEELLGTKKIAIDYDDMPKYQKTPEGRVFMAQYCVKDAWLPCQIIVKRCKLVNALQMAQVTGVPLTDILNRGQQVRTLLLMLQYVKARCRRDSDHPRWFLPDESANKPPPTEGFEGAVVIRPLPGFYKTPVVTLDFASLYPSIMRAYNMCFSTLIPTMREARQLGLAWTPETHDIKDPESPGYPEMRPVRSFNYPEGGRFDYVTNDNDVCFVTTKKRQGILPEILEALLSERKRVKKMRKQFSEKSMDYAVLDGRQLALKVCANSVYGFTGAGMGYLGEKRIASSVTRVGRGMANHTKFMCEDRYKEHGLQIVYGDTDSVFANIPPSMCDTNCSQEELIRKVDQLGTEMGEFCTKAFLPPNDLEYEKFYYPILLKGKKRYAGHKFEPGLAPKLDVKGFECVRRDFAPIVSLTQKRVLVKLCKERDVEGAIQLAREVVLQLLHNNVPLEHLIMSKQLTRRPQDYKNPAPHTHLAQRLQATQPAHIAPKTGDRIDYLIRPGFKGEKTYLRSVSPEDVREGRASVDTRWYLSNQLQKPLQRIFEMLMDNSSDIFRVDSVSQTHAMSNDVMRGFVQRTTADTRTRSAVRIRQRPRKKQKTKTMDIRAFFK